MVNFPSNIVKPDAIQRFDDEQIENHNLTRYSVKEMESLVYVKVANALI